ncbi:MAG: 4Fe-4S binding protein [Zoogloeaceae bacterium]|nr:4Fe-4S binding protein [Zoogloeaceae bacterium]
MALRITADCISCGACDYICPNDAIMSSPLIYSIDAARCSECERHFDEPQCLLVCPVDCIVRKETKHSGG